jgi:hypothetical protein
MENYGRDKLGIEEFFNEVLDLVSRKIVSDTYIEENEDFVNTFIADLYQNYLDGSSIKSLSDIVENTFYNLFLYKPGLKNI